MPGPHVVVTGAFGNVGRTVVRQLLADGHSVVAADLDTPLTRKASAKLRHDRLVVRWADLTDPLAATDLLAATLEVSAVIHLAAVIPPTAYTRPDLARRVNVEGTGYVVAAVAAHPRRPRLVFASSMAVYGSRNPRTSDGAVTGETPPRPAELYGAHKVEAERLITAADVDWAILRLGAVVSHELVAGLDLDQLFLEAALPVDARLHAVDVRDVARAFSAAVTANCLGRVLLIGGDESNRLTQGRLSQDMTAAVGLGGLLPPGLPGNPADEHSWFCVDWLDTDEAEALLGFQRVSWHQTLADTRAAFGAKRHAAPLVRLLGRRFLARRSPYHRSGAVHADPWGVIARRWGAGVLVGGAQSPR